MRDRKVPYDRPHKAPETVTAADGETQLHGFRVEAVVYAPDRLTAERRIRSPYTKAVLNHARVTGPQEPREDGTT